MRAALLAVVFLTACSNAPQRRIYYCDGAVDVCPPEAFTHPGYAPAGAGLPEYMPVDEVPKAERGKDRRVLPPTREPGIWASDGDETRAMAKRDRADQIPVYVAGVKVQLPRDRSTAAVRSCADIVSRALTESGAAPTLASWNADVQQCEVLRMVENCLARRGANKTITTTVRDEAEASQRLVAKARATACHDIARTPEHNNVRAKVVSLLRRELGGWQNVTELDEDLR